MLSKHAFGYGTKLHQKLGLIAVLMMQTEFFCWTNETYQNKWNYNFLNLDIWMLDLTERKSQFSILTSGSAPWRTEVWEWSGKCWQHWCIVFKAAQNRMHCVISISIFSIHSISTGAQKRNCASQILTPCLWTRISASN